MQAATMRSLCLLLPLMIGVASGQEETPDPGMDQWQTFCAGLAKSEGPVQARLGTMAEVGVPEGRVFLEASAAKELLSAWGNIPSGRELGAIVDSEFLRKPGLPAVFFEFDAIGFVKDDEKDDLDADAILEGLRKNQEAGNVARKERGYSTLTLTGWQTPPRFDDTTKNLEWGIAVQDSEGTQSINYDVRLLGRNGVMNASLLCNPEAFAGAQPLLRSAIGNFRYLEQHRYGDYQKGDKLAEYGLIGLIGGGGLLAAGKLGFFKLLGKFWKFVAAGVAALVVAIKKLFGGGSSNRSSGSASAQRRIIRPADGSPSGDEETHR